MNHGPTARALGAALIFFAALGPARSAAPAVPAVHAAPQATLPLNDILHGEWDIALGTLGDGTAYETRIPYTDTLSQPTLAADLARYGANLHHNEDPRHGVTVSAVLTDPAGATHTYPCWYGEDFAVDTSGGRGDQQKDHLQRPTGYAGWHLDYPAKTLGAWSGHLTVTDAGGTATGPTFTFTVAGQLAFPDAAKGRLSVSAADPRNLKYDDGDVWLPLGESGNENARILPHLAAARLSHARLLVRWWQSTFGGAFGVTGGPDYSSPQDPAFGQDSEDSHSGRYSYKVTRDGGLPGGTFGWYAEPGQADTYRMWVRNVGCPVGTHVGLSLSVLPYTQDGTLPTADVNGNPIYDGAWHQITGSLPANQSASPKQAQIVVRAAAGGPNTGGGYFLTDDLVVTPAAHDDPAEAPGCAWDEIGGAGANELQNTLDQAACASQRAVLDQCRLSDANALIEFFSWTDRVQGSIRQNGTDEVRLVNMQGNDGGNQMGQYPAPPASAADDGAETAVGLFHAQQVREWVARFGAYVGQGIAYVAYANETPVGGAGSNPQVGPEHWAVQMRGVTPDVQPLCGLDTYYNSGGSQWYDTLYASPWLQFDEPHVSVSGKDIPFDTDSNEFYLPGVTRHATGGPAGQGYVEIAQAANGGPLYGVQLPTMAATGTWTLSCYAQTVPDAAGRPYNGPVEYPQSQVTQSGGLYLTASHANVPGYTDANGHAVVGDSPLYNLCAVPTAGLAAWTKLSGSFAVNAPSQSPHLQFRNDQPAGNVRYAAITLTDPSGHVFWRQDFNEPLLDQGAGDAVAVWGDPYGYGADGTAAAGKPVVIGESEAYYDPATAPPHVTTGPGGTASSTSLAFPMNQYALREAAAMVDARWHADTLWYEDSQAVDAGGYGAFFHTMQALLDGFLLPDGSWREAATAQSGFAGPGEPFVVYGQANSRDAATGDGVAATKAVLSVLPLQPDPAAPHAFLPGTGAVDLQGLADAPYTVQEYDAASGQLVATLTASSAGGHLSLNFVALATGMVVKVSPVTAPALSVRLAADHATAKPGDVVTYTLTYTNTGKAPALGVTVPWAVPTHMQFLSASGGTVDRSKGVVNWKLGTLAPGASGSLVLKARVQ